ncbi:MAG TPA: nucleotidyltransferase domain-containing protein [Candidatus Babeliales bacterium]|jgi:predicted nucleotidyltransferase|nr:nucleotidyltransferase domain-containing protein [Candidatus Babeliales bacterium]
MVKDFTALYRKIIEPIIIKYAPDAKIILYGSRARGDFRQGSDIDVAVDMGYVIDRHVINKILGDVEESKLPIGFDIVDFRKVSEDMQKEIMKDGIVWK